MPLHCIANAKPFVSDLVSRSWQSFENCGAFWYCTGFVPEGIEIGRPNAGPALDRLGRGVAELFYAVAVDRNRFLDSFVDAGLRDKVEQALPFALI